MNISSGTKKLIVLALILVIIGVAIFAFSKISGKNDDQEEKKTTSSVEKENVSGTKVDIPDGVKTVTKDLKIDSRVTFNKKTEYGCSIYTEDGDYESVSVDAKKFNLPSNIYKYKSEISLRLTYSEDDYKVYNCEVVNNQTGRVITNLTEDGLEELFDIEYGKNPIKQGWADVVKLSYLKEHEIYTYTATEDANIPEIENDTGKNCIIYIKEPDFFGEPEDASYEKHFSVAKTLDASKPTVSDFYSSEIKKGESVSIMYKTATTDELLDLVSENEIVYLSKSIGSDNNLDYSFEDYIYNDTNKDVKVKFEEFFDSGNDTNYVIIKAGELYEFDWRLDSIKVVN